MSVPFWPSELPRPTRNGYQMKKGDPRIAKSRETGPIGWRRRSSSYSNTVGLSLILDRSEKAVFDQFYDHDTQAGSLPFWMPDPVTDGWPLLTSDGLPLLMDDNTPILLSARWLCLWSATPPSESLVGMEFQIAFSVEVLP